MLTKSSIPLASPTNPFGWQLRFLPSLTDLVFVFPVLYLLFRMQGVSTLLGDGDTGWHIRTGEWILQNHRVPNVDIFSFSKPGQPWFAWEWLWDVCFALLHQAGGLAAVVIVNIALLGAIFALLYRYIRRQCTSDLISVLVTLVALAATSVHWLARPHLISWLLILIFRNVLTRAAEGQTRLLWFLPLLTIAWTNLHGAFFVGIALVLAYAIDPFARGHWKKGSTLLACGTACAAASFMNPYTYQLHTHLVSYLLDSKQLENILEFQSMSFHHPLALYFELMLALGTFAVAEAWKRGRYTEVVLFFVWAHLGLLAIRNIPIFILFAAPMVARSLAGRLERFPAVVNASARFQAMERVPRFHLAPAGAFALLLLLMAHPGDAALLRSEYNSANYPAVAVGRLRATASSRIFTDDEWGDYLIYRLYPAKQVFVDGRSDFYGAGFEAAYIDLMNVRYDWDQSLAQYAVDTVLLRAKAPLAGAMKESPRWKVVYDDGIALIFLRTESSAALPAPPLSAHQRISIHAPERGKDL